MVNGKTIKPVEVSVQAVDKLMESRMMLLGVTAVIVIVMIVLVVMWKRDLNRKIKDLEEAGL